VYMTAHVAWLLLAACEGRWVGFVWLSCVLCSPVAFAFVLVRFSFSLEISGFFLLMSECRLSFSCVHVCA